jgi:uncharacterized LabA/DUF88 family protein
MEKVASNELESNYVFIDSQNLNLAIRGCGWEIDFKKFHRYLEVKYNAKRSYLFIGYVEGNQALYTSLQEAGFICIFKPTLKLADGKVKGNVDAELVLHTMIHLNNFDKAVIVSGDGDFFCLVEYLLQNNKLKKLLIPNEYKYSSLYKKLGSKTTESFFDFVSRLKFKISKDR